MQRVDGFTLIELVIVMLVISIAAVTLTGLFGNTATSLTTNETLQRSAQYAQECAERTLAIRRDRGFDSTSIGNAMCDDLTLDTGFSRTVSVTTISGAGSPCPIGTDNCKMISINVAHSSGASSPIILMLVK